MKKKVTEKIKEFFNSTPPAIRWMLLGAAFIVVLILLILLVNKPKQPEHPLHADRKVDLIISPATAELLDVAIGTKDTQIFKITSTYGAVIDSITTQDTVDGVNVQTDNCKNQPVNENIGCKVTVTFAPAKPALSGTVKLVINWHDQEDSRDINPRTDDITIQVSSQNKQIEEPKPVVAPKPEPEPEPEPEEPEESEDNGITGSRPVFDQPEPVPEPEPKPQPKKKVEKCSDFAMPGYSTGGAQIGWIKPSNGRYEFHPFSDKDCNKPTGIYNPNTGIITSMDGKKKIGTDADHLKSGVDFSSLPKLTSRPDAKTPAEHKEHTPSGMSNWRGTWTESGGGVHLIKNEIPDEVLKGTAEAESVYSSMPYDRTFILRQFKPIPATIVSEVRADPSVYGCDSSGKCDPSKSSGIPVRATVDRNVYSDNGRTVIIPTGTLLMGYLTGELPGPYKSIGRMKINWYQFIRPDGVEFNFAEGQDPYSADSQGRVGVPGYGSTDYVEQMVMPLLTAIIPAAVNMIAPIADTFVNQIDLDNNTVVQSGTVRSSELAKNEIITAWNQIAQKLMVDALDNTVPPFSIAAGTRITVYSPVDLIATCGDKDDKENAGKKCAFHSYESKKRRPWSGLKGKAEFKFDDASWRGQVRSFNLAKYCKQEKNVWTVNTDMMEEITASGYDYRTVLAYCQAQNYQATNQAKYEAYYQNKTANAKYSNTSSYNEATGKIETEYSNKDYNKEVLGLEYEKDEEGNDTDIIKNPFEKPASAPSDSVGSLDCDGAAPDANGCCPGETYTDMGEQGFNCCPAGGGDCFPPLNVE